MFGNSHERMIWRVRMLYYHLWVYKSQLYHVSWTQSQEKNNFVIFTPQGTSPEDVVDMKHITYSEVHSIEHATHRVQGFLRSMGVALSLDGNPCLNWMFCKVSNDIDSWAVPSWHGESKYIQSRSTRNGVTAAIFVTLTMTHLCSMLTSFHPHISFAYPGNYCLDILCLDLVMLGMRLHTWFLTLNCVSHGVLW